MAHTVIIAEKPSAAQHMAEAFGGRSGNFDGTNFVIVNARGHLYEFVKPPQMVDNDKQAQYQSWRLDNLPWDEDDFHWKRGHRNDVAKEISAIRREAAKCQEIVIASDIDPSGEGDLLIWEIIDELDLHDKKITRMEFVDEAKPSLQKAFKNRRVTKSMQDEGDFRKADYRSKFDYLSMQWTRIASSVLLENGRKAIMRNGRLKSAMVLLIGRQIDAHKSYVKKPVYMPRFVDDHGVIYSHKDKDFGVEDSKDKVDLTPYPENAEVVAHEPKQKRKAPPKLLDISTLSAMLSKKGYSAKDVLEKYQKMYEARVVSYPRTTDNTVTEEQFNELKPLIDDIAAVAGVNTALLTHREPRKTHVKNTGAHGANRPGPNVPTSRQALRDDYGALGEDIYITLAKNYLTIVAEDYVYDQHKGHIKDFEDFVGIANVKVSAGWRDVFVQDAEISDDADDDEESQGLGTTAQPEVGERVNKKPSWPSQGWLMAQLKKEDVGTGATRTSTFGDVSSGKYALVKDTSGKLDLTDLGEMNYVLLPNTYIGSLDLTRKVYDNMEAIAKDELTTAEALKPVKDWIVKDISVMRDNAAHIDESKGKKFMTEVKERAQGTWNGKEVSFAREYAGYRFSDEEVEQLLNGETIEIQVPRKDGNDTSLCTGKLDNNEWEQPDGEVRKWFGFKGKFSSFNPKTHARGHWVPEDRDIKFKRSWGGHEFTDEEIESLLGGDKITFELNGDKVTGGLEAKQFTNDEGKTIDYVGFTKDIDLTVYAVGQWKGEKIKFKRVWGNHEFSDQEIADLLADKTIEFQAMSKADKAKGKESKPYTAKGKLEHQVFEKNGKSFPFVGFKADFGKKK